ncbi:hypothetical protein HUJ05_005463 [Dendroctonus ponderosae]|nr:hypothetical protein HUJ05_005463 [Dendroctonus ponderosae]
MSGALTMRVLLLLVCLASCEEPAKKQPVALKELIPISFVSGNPASKGETAPKTLVVSETKLNDLSALKNVNLEDFEIIVNDYVDKLLENVQCLITNNNLDPTPMPSQDLDITIGQANITEGQLKGMSTIKRHGNAVLVYDSQSKQLRVDLILGFQDIKFVFDYFMEVVVQKLTGQLHGSVDQINMHVKLGFDFAKGLTFVDHINYKNKGKIRVWLTGKKLADWISNAMTSTVTGLLHNLVLDIVRDSLRRPVSSVVDAVNQVLHPKCQQALFSQVYFIRNLTNLATIERYHNATLSYDSDNDTLALEFILRWEDIELSYKFHSQVELISSTGHVVAKVEHLKIHLKLVADLELVHLEEDSMDFNQTGAITLTYTGVGLLDYILDAMSDTLTAVLHNYVLEKVREIVMDPVDDVIDAVNDFLDDILRPTTTG